LISELLDFTGEDGKQDNLVDAFVYAQYSFEMEIVFF
jgi:hypothetical protein